MASLFRNKKVDLEKWNASFLEHYTVVDLDNDRIVGFGDIDKIGYLDRLYVHKDYLNRGIATAICNELEGAVHGTAFSTHASITTKTFFEKRGYKVIKKQEVERAGITLINYIMKK